MNPFTSILNLSQTNIGWDLVKAVTSYYGLRDYINFRYHEMFQPDKVTTIEAYSKTTRLSGDEIFWKSVFSNQLDQGSLVRLLNFQISPWFPRKPGLYWRPEAKEARRIAKKDHILSDKNGVIVYDVWGKTLVSELGGIGTVNFRKNRSSVPITVTASGHTERGIPIICSQDVWRQISDALKRYELVEVDLDGIVQPTPIEFDSFLLRTPGLPKLAVYVNSILNLKLKVSSLRILVSPWTIFETRNRHMPYGFAYVTRRLSENDMHNAIQWLTDYIERYNATMIVTDFDEESNSLNARFPLSSCIDGSVVTTDIVRFCQEVANSFKN